jgi:hypothetical protein
MAEEHLQQQLFTLLLSRFPTKGEAVTQLCTLLNIGKSALYDRMSGAKEISLSEAAMLLEHFQLPGHLLFPSKPQDVMFDYVPLAYSSKKDENYLERIIAELSHIAAAPNGLIRYMAPDIPLFYYFQHKELAYFKLYLYQHFKTTMPVHRLPKISFAAITKADEARFQKVKELYARVPSEEIWTSRAFRVTLDEIQYFIQADLFQDKNDAVLLLQKMADLLERLSVIASNKHKQSICATKGAGQEVKLFFNDFNKFNPTIITQMGEDNAVYVAYELPHYLKTKNTAFVDYSLDWFDRIRHKSFPVSDNANVIQGQFFTLIKQRIKKDIKNLEKTMA